MPTATSLFVDYAGDTVPVIVDRVTGKTRPAKIFVALLGASNFTYAEASWTQTLAFGLNPTVVSPEAIWGAVRTWTAQAVFTSPTLYRVQSDGP